ncbi:hypothetical protein ABL78_0822 [Leptomonas seymouri]|uniref:Uncharacterized protein n=1 Tax=Leptomonas seymouri TaxID=5684 RepID=A0A0N0P8L3_LEPSE|nr:hypothetical protein ABL78_0822 [Leptomonas seymouri]|eukprot:KPI90069.1 hypothetical protein ABL78_0822 [Leptomonas seymouri]
MLRSYYCKQASRRASLVATLPPCNGCYRSYATGHSQQSTNSWTKERRYYTDPLRAPQSGVRTVVGRFVHHSRGPTAPASAGVACDAATRADATNTAKASAAKINTAEVNTATRCLATHSSLKTQVMEVLSAHGRKVCYDSAGIPVEGSWYLLPWREQMRILAAVIGALCITKAFFDGVRFELLYYGVWKLGYRNEDSFVKRMLYYGSTALMASGLFLSFNLNFFLSAWLVGRREIAAHMVCNGFVKMMPRRTIQLIERRLKLRLV